MRSTLREQLAMIFSILRWVVIITPMALAIGSACALFLWLLEEATQARWRSPWLLYLLPVAGLAIGLMYHWLGRSVESGNNLIMDEIHEPGGGVPLRMAPLVLIGTLVTHLFGGSAGREGTAVQMGGSLAGGWSRVIKPFITVDIRILLMAGIAAGFGGVFGTPVAGAIFAIEVIAIGRMNYAAIVPCLIASIASDWACQSWGVGHTHYHVASIIEATPAGAARTEAPAPRLLDGVLLLKVVVAAVAFGLVSLLFARTTHGVQQLFRRFIGLPWLRPVMGGIVVIAMVWLAGTRDYLGIGVTGEHPDSVSIVSAFSAGGADTWSWLLKLIFTAITLGAGFKGGEVTPLFFIGAALGNTLAWVLHAPVDLFAALGFVAVFAGATNTPLACTLMAVELFGPSQAIYFAIACFVAYLFSGHTGIYTSQRIGVPKIDAPPVKDGT